MKELDPFQFCVLLSFIELGIWRVKNRHLPLGTRSLETKSCRGRVGRRAGGGVDPGSSRKEQDEQRLARGGQGQGREACQLVVWALYYLLWRALRATQALPWPCLRGSVLTLCSLHSS